VPRLFIRCRADSQTSVAENVERGMNRAKSRKGRSDPPLWPDQDASAGSIPILSFTAMRSFCLQADIQCLMQMRNMHRSIEVVA